jgi:hypothetical protein
MYYLAANNYCTAFCAILLSASSVVFMKLSFAKPFPKKGILGISIFHSASIFVLFSDSGLKNRFGIYSFTSL